MAMDADKQQVISLLTVLSSVPDTSDAITDEEKPSLSILSKDLISLLSLLYASTTKLALALNPSSPAYSASITPINDILQHTQRLCHCLSFYSAPASSYGDTLGREVQIGVSDVLQAVRDLAKSLLDFIQGGSGEGKRLVKTGAVHDVITQVKGSLSKDNLEAARKKWTLDNEMLQDSIREVEEMLEDREDEEDEDGWDELGLGGSAKLSQEERERTAKVHQILRLTASVHKRILSDALKPPGPGNRAVDRAVLQSAALLASVDEVVASAYTPQDVEELEEELEELRSGIESLETAARELGAEKAGAVFGLVYRAFGSSNT